MKRFFMLTILLTTFVNSLSPVLLAQSMAQRLGYSDQARLLIINADDFGMCHAENMATMGLLKDNVINSATAMVPCAWFKEAALFCKKHPDLSVGIHLTLTNEWKRYKWGPVTPHGQVSSLITENGFFPEECLQVEQQAKTAEVKLELENQIKKAIKMGLTPSHLDNHMGSVYGLETGRDFLEIVFELCEKYQLPFRLPVHIPDHLKAKLPPEAATLFKARAQQALKKGIMLIDYIQFTQIKPDYEAFREGVIQQIKNLKPGLTEIYIHPALPTDEMKAISSAWRHRDFEARVFRDPLVQKVLKNEKIISISWLKLREHQQRK